jgi:molybdopterin molybdotransferase
MISAEKALQIVLENTRTLEPMRVPVLDAIDMVLAEDLIAAEDYPPFDKCAIEGYAVKSADIACSDRGKPTTLVLDGEIKVGESWDKPLESGHAVKVAAGALLPEGADTVVSSDFAARESTKKVMIYKSQKPGDHLVIRADDIEAGATALPRGRTISAADIGFLGTIGINEVMCYRRPKVSFFASGNDLMSSSDPMPPGKIRPTASHAIQVQLARYGAEPVNLGILEIDAERIKECMEKSLQCDMMIVTAGSSLNDFDYLKTILQKYGLDLKFWRVAIRPGKPFVFGMFDGIPVFGFSNNILPSMVVLEQFVRPSIMKMRGRCEVRRTEVIARLESDIKGGNGMTHFVRAEVRLDDHEFVAVPINSKNTPSVKAFYTANGFIVLPPEMPSLCAGDKVKVQIISDPASLN